MGIWYEVEVTAHDGSPLDRTKLPSLEMAKRAVTRFRELYPHAKWITTNRLNGQRVTALVSMTVHEGTTAQERRARAAKEAARERFEAAKQKRGADDAAN